MHLISMNLLILLNNWLLIWINKCSSITFKLTIILDDENQYFKNN
jgi:hypothetical protein